MKEGDKIICVRKGAWMCYYTIGKEYEVLSCTAINSIYVRNDKGNPYYLDLKNFKLIGSVNIIDDYQNF
jgi:hypothetical protein